MTDGKSKAKEDVDPMDPAAYSDAPGTRRQWFKDAEACGNVVFGLEEATWSKALQGFS